MPIAIKPNGEFEVIYSAPFTGVNVALPENQIPDSATPSMNDFMLRNGEIRSRPRFNVSLMSSPVGAGYFITAIGSLPVSGGSPILWATVVKNTISADANNGLWTFFPAIAQQAGSTGLLRIADWRVFNKVLYLSDAGSANFATWDGLTFTANTASPDGVVFMAGQFIDELDNHMLLVSTVEGSTFFPNRIRWSVTSNPGSWNPSTNVNAGFQDFLDVPDAMTGYLSLGRVGYIFRSDGVTEVAPTGQGAAPFQFNHLWANRLGLGNIKYGGTAAYGNSGIILGRDNIYRISSFDIEPIGGAARDSIYDDLGNTASSQVNGLGNVFGVIVPYLRSGVTIDNGITPDQNANSGTGLSLMYLTYWLFINLNGGTTVVWICNLDNQNSWERYTLPQGSKVTAKPSLCTDTLNRPALLVPWYNLNTTVPSIAAFIQNDFNDTVQGSSYTFRAEEVMPGRQITVRRVLLTYRDLGQATITVNLSATDDDPKVVTATSGAITIGTVGATGKLMTKLVDISLTGFRPQLQVTRAANGGPVSIVTAHMVGNVQVGSEF